MILFGALLFGWSVGWAAFDFAIGRMGGGAWLLGCSAALGMMLLLKGRDE